MKKTVTALLLVLMLVLSMGMMTGCGGDAYVVATEPTYPPFNTTDEDGNITGFDMDLMLAIAEDQGFEIEFLALEFDSLVPALESGSADIVAAAMNITPDRAEKVDFSSVYYASAKTLLVAKDNTTIKTTDDLTKDMKVAAQIGTSEADYIQALKEDGKIGEAVVLNKTTECIMQLQNGDVEAVIMDAPVAEVYLAKYPQDIQQAQAGIEPADMAFAVQKGNSELLELINAGLANMVENGTYDELVAKWFA